MDESEHHRRRERVREMLAMTHALVVISDDMPRFMRTVYEAGDFDAALAAVQALYDFDEVEARAALDMQTKRFTTADRQRISDARDELLRELHELDAIP